MTDLRELGQEGFLWGLSNSNHSGGSCQGEKPPPPEIDEPEKASRSKKRAKNGKRSGGGSGGGESSDHEIHIWTERERRKKMRNMFANLHALLPQLPPKADKSTIVDEAVNYIKTLQLTLQKLQKQKLERLQSASSATTFTYIDPPSSLINSHQNQLPTADFSREAFLADQISSNNTNIIQDPSVFYGSTPVAFQTWTSSNVVLNICGNEAQFSVCSPKDNLGFFSTVCYVLEKHKVEVVSAHISSDCNRSIYMIQARASSVLEVDEIYKQAAGEIMLWMSS